MYKIFILIFVMHVVAGHFLQTRKLSNLKRDKKRYLFLHVGIYTLFFIVFSPTLLDLTFTQGLVYSLINGVFHVGIDYVTGIFKTKYAENNNFNYKMTVIIDNILHLTLLIITYVLLFKESIFF